MTVLIDTSVLSLALLRRKKTAEPPAVAQLRGMLEAGERVVLTGVVLQEVLAGPRDAKVAAALARDLEAFPLLEPDRSDHEAAAALHRTARNSGIAAGTIDCLIATLAVRHRAALLTTDRDFTLLAPLCGLTLA